MNLATRCITCGTVFRVVEDQLKVSEGWVRCGRCDEVFNAVDTLFDLDQQAPPAWTAPLPAAAVLADAAPEPDSNPSLPPARRLFAREDVAELDEEDRIASRFFLPDASDAARSPADAVDPRDRHASADACFNESLPGGPELSPIDPPLDDDGTPAFVRHAEAQARRASPRARAVAALGCLLLVLTLGAQVAHHFRDGFAARWTFLKSPLTAWCAAAGCTIQPPRRIDDVQVEHTTLARAAAGTDTYRLSVTLHNRGSLPVALPALEVTLTDVNGQLVSRRALAPGDFQSHEVAIASNAEMPLQALLSTGSTQVSGYTVEVFYP